MHFGLQVVFIHDVLGENTDRHFHAFVSLHRCTQVKILDVEVHVACILCADDAVPQDLRCDEICCSRCQFPMEDDEVSSCRDAYPVWVFLLWSIVDDDIGVCDYSIR